jgi:hypothetical protein
MKNISLGARDESETEGEAKVTLMVENIRSQRVPYIISGISLIITEMGLLVQLVPVISLDGDPVGRRIPLGWVL